MTLSRYLISSYYLNIVMSIPMFLSIAKEDQFRMICSIIFTVIYALWWKNVQSWMIFFHQLLLTYNEKGVNFPPFKYHSYLSVCIISTFRLLYDRYTDTKSRRRLTFPATVFIELSQFRQSYASLCLDFFKITIRHSSLKLST